MRVVFSWKNFNSHFLEHFVGHIFLVSMWGTKKVEKKENRKSWLGFLKPVAKQGVILDLILISPE